MCISRLIEVRSRNHCCSGKLVSVTCSEFLFVALVIQHEKCSAVVLQENPSSCNGVVECGPTDGQTDRQTRRSK